MSYLVLARKLRPQKFQDLIGQEHIWKTLISAIEKDRVAHAFLFTGPRGTGKTSCARVLTKALNCTSPVDHEPCNQCENCLEINQGIATDVMEIDAASNRGIEHIRELREGVKFSPAKCTYKTYIIDEVHMLTTESFNALLKTLEEPPAHVKFILATTDHHKIPTTVISRCQRYDFTNISMLAMVTYLKKVAKAESLQLSDSALHLIASQSAGGMRDALTTLDMLIGRAGAQIENDDVIEILGLNDTKEIDDLLMQVIKKDLSQALTLFHGMINKGRSLAQLITDLSKSVKDLTLVKSLPAEKLQWHEFFPDQLEKYSYLAELTTLPTLQQYFHILLEIESQIKRSSQARTCVEMGLIKMCSVESLVGVAEVISLLRGTSIESKKKTSNLTERKKPRLPSKAALDQTPDFHEKPLPTSEPTDFSPPVEEPSPPPVAQEETPIPPEKAPKITQNPGYQLHAPPNEEQSVAVREPEARKKQKVGDQSGFSQDEIAHQWKLFVDEIEKQNNKSLLSLLRNSVVTKLTQEKLVISYKNIQVFSDEKKKTIAQAARDFFKTPIKVFYKEENEGIKDSLKSQMDQDVIRKNEELKEKAARSPKVLEILKVFPESKIRKITILKEL